jgi:hypothetical protein
MNHELFEIEKFGLGDKMNSVCGEMLNLVALRERELQNILKGWIEEGEGSTGILTTL